MGTAKYIATHDPANFVVLTHWDLSIYSLEPRQFWYSKTSLPISNGCEIVRYDFRSRIRFRGSLRTRGLQINFIDTYSTNGTRLQGMGKIDSIMMITPGGYEWDGLSDVGALAIEINFDEDEAAQIISPQSAATLEKMAAIFGTKKSVVVRPSKAAEALKELALRFLEILDIESGVVHNKNLSQMEQKDVCLPDAFSELSIFKEAALIEMAKTVIEEVSLDNVVEAPRSNPYADTLRWRWSGFSGSRPPYYPPLVKI